MIIFRVLSTALKVLVIPFTVQSASMLMAKIVAARALVFRPLVKGIEALGTRLALCTHCRPMMTDPRSCHHRPAMHGES